ncbi:LysM peptidoglycan-binding domain-containing protein [Spelaeicoccus albus]|uniref:Nucleoid-associated protein YgaU n=1 Tax=Spelaeicoccus albus TaxID=1280376 RepID=A0A7Z0D332_9MICO|nr:LysM domain-containing protein [Spelaeicoccus albus]NYI67967.1 nucleoid-associated protein YgaU [Spelaeicoccus albus]
MARFVHGLIGPVVAGTGAAALLWSLRSGMTMIDYLGAHRADPAGYAVAAAIAFLAYAAVRTALAGALQIVATIAATLPGGRGRAARLYEMAARTAPLLVRYALIGLTGVSAVACTAPPEAEPTRPAIVDPDWTAPGQHSRADRQHTAGPHRSAPPRTQQPSERPAVVVTVRRGDTLWSIAAARLPAGHSPSDVAEAWPRWYEANRTVIGDDPDMLMPGQHLHGPTS